MEAALFRKGVGGRPLKVVRPPSPPDSAYEHDPNCSDLSEEGHSTARRRDRGGGESDVDSGIVSCRQIGERIGSTSSDSSHESTTRATTEGPCYPVNLSKSRHSSLRILHRTHSQPIKADHSLKECNRRPPTPLSVFPDCVRFDEQLQLSEQNIRRSCRKLFATLYAHRFPHPSQGRRSSTGMPKALLPTYYKPPPDSVLSPADSNDSGLGSSTHCTCSTICTCKCCTCTCDSDLPKHKLFKSHSCSTLLHQHQSRPQLTRFPPRTASLRNTRKTSSCSSLVQEGYLQEFPVYSDNMVQVYARVASVVPPAVDKQEEGVHPMSPPRSRHSYDTHSMDEKIQDTRTQLGACSSNDSKHGINNLKSFIQIRPPPVSNVDATFVQVSPTSTFKSSDGLRPKYVKSKNQDSPFSHNSRARQTFSTFSHRSKDTKSSPNLDTTFVQTLENRSSKSQRPSQDMIQNRSPSRSSLDEQNHFPSQRSCQDMPQVLQSSSPSQMDMVQMHLCRSSAQMPSHEMIEIHQIPCHRSSQDMHQNLSLARKTSQDMHLSHSPSQRSSHDMLVNRSLSRKSSQDVHQNRNATRKSSQDMHQNRSPSRKSSQDMHQNRSPSRISSQDMHQNRSPNQRSSHDMVQFRPPSVSSMKSSESIFVQSRPMSRNGSSDAIPDSRSSTLQRHQRRPKSVGVVMPSPVYLKSALKKPTQSALLSVPGVSEEEAEYAVVDKSKKNRFSARSLPVLNDGEDKDPPVPPKKNIHKSDFSLYRSRSTSPRKSLLERVQNMTKNARCALQKAFSTERIYRPEREERLEGERTLHRSKSFLKGLTASFRRKKHKQPATPQLVVTHPTSSHEWDDPPGECVRGQLLQLNLDGSQVVELTKPQDKPYGFFVARGRVRNSKGVFVSRMRDPETQTQLSGLLDIGDEILEIDGHPVKDADILEVNRLMAHKDTLLLTLLPYICRKDV